MKTNTPGRERLLALSRREVPDRPPVSFWRHFYDKETAADTLAEALLEFHREFGWDWIKLNPRGSYHVEGWGFNFSPSTDPLVKPIKTNFPVKTMDDWAKIEPLNTHEGALGEHLDAIRRVVDGAAGDPVLMTIFSPLSIAGDLIKDDPVLVDHLREHPEKVETALEAITQTFEAFVTEVLNAGADGIFFATTQWASHKILTWDQYQRFGKPYDLRVLAKAAEATVNVLHVCEPKAFLEEMNDYPVSILNWGSGDEGNPSLLEGFMRHGKSVIGGVTLADLISSPPVDVGSKVSRLAESLHGLPWGCSPDCSFEPHSNVESLKAVKAAIVSYPGA